MITVERIESHHALIPVPHDIIFGDEFFMLHADSGIRVSETAAKTGQYLSEILSISTGFPFHVHINGDQSQDITLLLNPELSCYREEGYELEVDRDGIKIASSGQAGLFYGCQTFLQLLPYKIYSSRIDENMIWKVPFTIIRDTPRFVWRGAMLDVSRHFFSVQDIKRFIDLMAFHKLNRFHMHLSDDQGWRIQIKSRPRLTLHGGSSQVGEGAGGYYTQEEFKEIVSYAQDRYIMVVPEIDMPGHTNAALSSYAELNKDGRVTELYSVGYAHNPNQEKQEIIYTCNYIRSRKGSGQRKCYGNYRRARKSWNLTRFSPIVTQGFPEKKGKILKLK
ncbi:MAG: family 20 glycosylhydrolase [Spirochaetales bacterium]|nr:family 20 glycosylhydrolase [Spirochaetales bacterium]